MKVTVQLGKVGVGKFFDRLGLNHHLLVHHDVHDVGVRNAQSLIGDIQADLPEGLMTIEPECMGQADLVSVLQESGPQCLLESDCCTDDRLGYVPMRVILAPIFSPVPTHSLSPPKEEMRSTLAGDSVFFLFSASLSCLWAAPQFPGPPGGGNQWKAIIRPARPCRR